MTTRPSNRLAGETSPYLLQHAHNPVNWYPWGPEALELAAREDKPIFLSIGYAACHWCHVMERESFEDPEIAKFLNEHFVSIKVDREERPDIDDIYMAATLAISGSGGWPMSVFLAPDQRPFFAGTYFPPTDRYGRPGFASLLRRIAELWANERPAIAQQATELTRYVVENSAVASALPIDARSIDRAVMDLERTFDGRYGGFGAAPKFPPHQSLGLLLRHYRRTGATRSLEMARRTLDGMKNGGIYDHVGGGFARYSTDERWLVPHFEKMLYDNAQLAIAYLEAFQVTAEPEYRRVATETLDYVAREMQSPEGGFFSATDADSEGEEGKFFVFLPEDIDDILGKDDAEAFCLYYDVTVGGNWEGKNVLNTPRPLERVADDLGVAPAELAQLLASAKAKVYAARQERVPPLLDDKILTAWNGLMIGAMAEGHRVLREPRYLQSAERAADFVSRKLTAADGGLLRTIRGERAHISGFLEDYAYLGDGLVSLFETSGDPRWLDAASALAGRLIASFGDQGGAFFLTPQGHDPLIARPRSGQDGALPSPNAVAARLLVRLSYHLDRPEWRERAIAAITDYGQLIERAPRAFATTLNLVDLLVEGPTELVVAGAPASRETVLSKLAAIYLPNRVLELIDPERPIETPLAAGKAPVDGNAALYVCRDFACRMPAVTSEEIEAALSADQNTRTRAPAVGSHPSE